MGFWLNGEKKGYSGDPARTLLNYLRESEGLISLKQGCANEGVCGCCMVQIDDKAVLSCLVKMGDVENVRVLTNDGIEPAIQEALADAFVERGGVQCGFCTPGIVMQAKVLLDQNPNPSREEVVKALNRNLCRCTGYHKIVDAVLLAGKSLREKRPIKKEDQTARVGKRYRKYNARETALGFREFVGDMRRDGMLFGALKFSDHPRAKVVAIDVAKAQAVPGVSRVFTAEDVPGQRDIGLIVNDWPVMVKVGEETRYIGDVLAGVVAETEEIARAAAAEIQVDYEVLEPVTDVFAAMEKTTPKVHESGNVLSHSYVKRGDVDRALKEAAFVSKGRYETQRIEHAFLEPEACLAEPWSHDGKDGVKVSTQGQGAYEDRKQLARVLKLPEEQVNVIQVETGGAFGGKEDLSIQAQTALFAYLLKKPIRMTLTRTESIQLHPKRHPFIMDYTLGCDGNGKLTFLKADLVADTGAYASVGMKVVERAVGHAGGAYVIPNIEISGKAVYTNNLPCGAMRGFGVNQSNFAIESTVDDLCAQGNFDRWQMRYDNALKDGDATVTGQIIKGGAGVRATLLALKEEFRNAKYAGIACGIKNTGLGNGMADTGRCKIEVVSDQKIILHHGWTEMGQGVHTMGVQTLCQETGLDPRIIEVRVDTKEGAECGMTTASRGTSLLGNAVINACREFKADLKKLPLKKLKGKIYPGEWVCDWTTKPGKPNVKGEDLTHYSYGYATQVVVLNDLGKIDVVYAAHDAGKIMNPTLFEGQIEGSIHMGLGYALTEDLPMKEGRLVSTKFGRCGVLRPRYMPKTVVKGIEVKDPFGPYGAKGVGEIGLVPTAAAVANALFQLDQKRRHKLPLKEKKVLT